MKICISSLWTFINVFYFLLFFCSTQLDRIPVINGSFRSPWTATLSSVTSWRAFASATSSRSSSTTSTGARSTTATSPCTTWRSSTWPRWRASLEGWAARPSSLCRLAWCRKETSTTGATTVRARERWFEVLMVFVLTIRSYSMKDLCSSITLVPVLQGIVNDPILSLLVVLDVHMAVNNWILISRKATVQY